jgi:TRAP-type C4-dicarboxylate transport system substrate-binding protein
MKSVAPAIAIAAALWAVAGCGSSQSHHTVVLRLETDEMGNVWHFPAVERFVDRVSQLSHGTLSVRPMIVTLPTGDTERYPATEARLVRNVAAGRSDLAFVDTWVFGSLGVRSFDALDAPLLIDNYATERAVVTSRLADEMLGRLRPLGVDGLALLAGRLRKPVAKARPLLGPAGYRAPFTFRTQPSRLPPRAIAALGARVNSAPTPFYVFQGDYSRGRLNGLDEDLDSVFTDLPGETPYVTANVNLWPRTATIIANPRRLAGLSAQERDWIHRAAGDAVAYSTDVGAGDPRLAREFCAYGGRLANASDADLAALKRAFQPVYAELWHDPATRAFVRRVTAIKRHVHPGRGLRIPPGCGAGRRPDPSAASHSATTIPNGIYRVRITRHDLQSGGASAVEFVRSAGVFTLTLRDGRFRFEKRESPPYLETGFYRGACDHAMFFTTFSPQISDLVPTKRMISMHFVPGRLEMAAVTPGVGDITVLVWFGTRPWEKIG